MITDFLVQNYRRFSRFNVENMSRVNVFVGRNNAGKTSLLEALYLYSMGLDVDVLQSIAFRRGEVVLDLKSSAQVDCSHFFNGHKVKNDMTIQLGTKANYYKLKIAPYVDPALDQSIFALDPEPVGMDSLVRFGATVLQTRGNDVDRRICEMGLTAEGVVLKTNRFVPVSAANRNRNYFILPDSLDHSMLSSLWNKVQLANKEEDVIRALRILEPRAQSLGFLLPEQIGRYVSRPLSGVVLGMEGYGKKLPLGSLGDGMKRLLAIALALTCSKGGALLIDEVDAGFHYSVMKDLWRLIIKTAKLNDVQVFVTTHSIDCLRGLSVLKEYSEDQCSSVGMYSIRDDMNDAIYYSADEIEKIIDSEIEVR